MEPRTSYGRPRSSSRGAVKELTPYFNWWRTTVIRDREIVDAEVAHEFRNSPEFESALEAWPGRWYWTPESGAGRITMVRILQPDARERWLLHIGLFALTFVTVTFGGLLLTGVYVPIGVLFSVAGLREGFRILAETVSGAPALDFSMAVMAILLAHETGHYVLAKYYKINASPPYFLPGPWPVTFVGTLGAFIRLRSPIVDRRQLIDVGAAGPWAGFVVAVVALGVGLERSSVASISGVTDQFVSVMLGNTETTIFLGDSALMIVMRELIVGEGTVHLTPLAFAGWVGVLVTMLNLLPIGQLDGGHVIYALFGEKQRVIGVVFWLGLLVLGFQAGQYWWWLWAFLLFALSRGQLGHPQVLDRHAQIPKSRGWLGWLTVILFVVTFMPAPIYW